MSLSPRPFNLIVFIEAQPGENGNGPQRKVTEIIRVHGMNRERQLILPALKRGNYGRLLTGRERAQTANPTRPFP